MTEKQGCTFDHRGQHSPTPLLSDRVDRHHHRLAYMFHHLLLFGASNEEDPGISCSHKGVCYHCPSFRQPTLTFEHHTWIAATPTMEHDQRPVRLQLTQKVSG